MPRNPSDALPLSSRADAAVAPASSDPAAEVVRWLFPAYILLILLGFFALRTPGAMPIGTAGHDRAVFQSINAATGTGFQLAIHPSEYFMPGKVILFVLTVAGTVFSLLVGGLAVKRILRLPWRDSRLVWATLICEAAAIVIGMAVNVCPGGEPAATLFDSAFQSAAAFANSGLYISRGGPPLATDATTHLLLVPMAVLGGLGLTVLIELYDSLLHQRPISRHAKIVLGMTAGLYLLGVLLSIAFQLMSPTAVAAKSAWAPAGQSAPLWRTVLLNASFGSLNARTLGLPVAPVFRDFPAVGFVTLLLMIVGASPGGTGGGLKTTTLHMLLAAPGRVFRGQALGRPFAIAAVWLGMYLGAVCLIYPLMLRFAPQVPGEQSLFLTVSALSNVGLSSDRVAVTGVPLYLLSVGMFFGRLAPLLVLWWMADTTREAEAAVG